MSTQPGGTPAPRKRSGGPKTPAGKARSALNALKHGRYSRSISVLSLEDDQVFLELLDAYNQHLRPQNHVQARLVNELAHIDWTLTRWRSIEVAYINRAFSLRAHTQDYDVGDLEHLTAVLDAEVNNSRFLNFITTRITRLLAERNNALRTLNTLRRHDPITRPGPLEIGLDSVYIGPDLPPPNTQTFAPEDVTLPNPPAERTRNELKQTTPRPKTPDPSANVIPIPPPAAQITQPTEPERLTPSKPPAKRTRNELDNEPGGRQSP